MAKGFILAITTAMILVILVLYMQNFSINQTRDLERISQMLVAEKVAHMWMDVREDISIAAMLLIEKNNNTVTFYDSLPAPSGTVSNFLSLYGKFVSDYYRTPDTDINFLSPDGTEMDLGSLPAKITILPFNIQYYYPNWAKDNLTIKVPQENSSVLLGLNMILNFSNFTLDCGCSVGGVGSRCNQFDPPPKSCNCDTLPRDLDCVYLNISVSDYTGFYCRVIDQCTDLSGQNKPTWNFHMGAGTSMVIPIQFPELLNVQLSQLKVNTSTSLILNTSDFYISYLSKLAVRAVNYNTSRVDWS